MYLPGNTFGLIGSVSFDIVLSVDILKWLKALNNYALKLLQITARIKNSKNSNVRLLIYFS